MCKKCMFNQQEFANKLHTGWAGKIIDAYESIDSTNAQAKRDAANGAEHGTLILADMQTAGRGRRGRSWESPAGANLYFSLLLRPHFAPDKAAMITLVMALAVVKGIETVYANMPDCPAPKIKWPNDIVINGKKVCGILTEMSVSRENIDYVIIGVGVNVNRQEFALELADKATSLEAECGQKLSKEILLGKIMEAFEEYYGLFERRENLADLQDAYHQRLVNRNREVCILDPKGEYRGIAKGITDGGELCVELPDGSITQVYAGEVSVRGIYGYV